jgi:uncharacterized delta-60 repeat protein
VRSGDLDPDGRWRGRLRDGITPVPVDDELLLLDHEAGNIVRLDGDATRALAGGDAAVSTALDDLGVTTHDRRQVLDGAAIAALGISLMALPSAAAAVSPGLAGVTATGTTELGFDPVVSGDSVVEAIRVQPDGKILIGGVFSTVGGVTRGNIARLNQDGTLDNSFTPPAVATGGTVRAIGLQSNGSVIVGAIGGTSEDKLLRLHPNGARDDSFPASIPNGQQGTWSLVVLPDDRILIGGSFSSVVISGVETSRGNIARFNADGTLDANFSPTTNGVVQALVVDRDGRIVLGGGFRQVNETSNNRSRIARLHSNGALDADFNPSSSSNVLALLIQPNSPGQPESIVVGGQFTSMDGVTTNRLVRLSDSGSVIQAFDPGFNTTVDALARQADGSIIVGGRFITFDNAPQTRIARFSASGALDQSFGVAVNGDVRVVTVQSDGRIVLGGAFSEVGGQARLRIARLT